MVRLPLVAHHWRGRRTTLSERSESKGLEIVNRISWRLENCPTDHNYILHTICYIRTYEI